MNLAFSVTCVPTGAEITDITLTLESSNNVESQNISRESNLRLLFQAFHSSHTGKEILKKAKLHNTISKIQSPSF